MPKFKVGDRVKRVRNGAWLVPLDSEHIVTRYDQDAAGMFLVLASTGDNEWDADYFELVEPAPTPAKPFVYLIEVRYGVYSIYLGDYIVDGGIENEGWAKLAAEQIARDNGLKLVRGRFK